MENNLVSILIPCFNGERFLDQLFHSILNQTYKKIQLIFINDGSTDATEQYAEKYKTLFHAENMDFVYLLQRNQGQAAAINTGISYVKGEFLMWMDCDDFLDEKCIEKKADYLKRHENIDVVMCKGNIYEETNLESPIDILGKESPVGTLFEDVLFSFRSCQCGLYMVRTEALFSELHTKSIYESPAGQNMQLLLPILVKGRIGYLPDKLYNYVIHCDSHSHSIHGEVGWKERLDNLEDMKCHVLSEMSLDWQYKEELYSTLFLQMNVLRMNKLGDSLMKSEERYMRNVCRKYKENSNVDIHLGERKIYLWGACEKSAKVEHYLEKYTELRIEGYIDSNPKLAGKFWNEKRVLAKDDVDRNGMFLFIPIAVHFEIVSYLEERGFCNGKDFYYPNYDIYQAVKERKDESIFQ